MFYIGGYSNTRSGRCKNDISNANRYLIKVIKKSKNVDELIYDEGWIGISLKDLLNETFTFNNSVDLANNVGNLNSGLTSTLSNIQYRLNNINVSEDEDDLI